MVTRLLVLASLTLVACAYGDPGHPRAMRGDSTAFGPPTVSGGGGGGGEGNGGQGMGNGGGGGGGFGGVPSSPQWPGPNCNELQQCCGRFRGYYRDCGDYLHGDEQQCLNGLGLFCWNRPNPEDGDGSQCDGSIANDHMIDCAMTVTYP